MRYTVISINYVKGHIHNICLIILLLKLQVVYIFFNVSVCTV